MQRGNEATQVSFTEILLASTQVEVTPRTPSECHEKRSNHLWQRFIVSRCLGKILHSVYQEIHLAIPVSIHFPWPTTTSSAKKSTQNKYIIYVEEERGGDVERSQRKRVSIQENQANDCLPACLLLPASCLHRWTKLLQKLQQEKLPAPQSVPSVDQTNSS